jgi:imidazolonepropionase-like amidohydrolase
MSRHAQLPKKLLSAVSGNIRMFAGASALGLAVLFATSRADAQSIYIRNVTIIDASDPRPRPEQSVTITDGYIVDVGPFARRPPGATIVEGSGMFLIPGLWDMHVHLDVPAGRELLEAYVVNGVTGVRDMAGRWETLTGWRSEIRAGKLTGPRIYASGPYLEGNPQPIPHIVVRTPEDAQRGVDSLKKLGVDVVKIHTGLSRGSFLAAASRARELNIPFAGHVPRSVSAMEASEAGMRSLEHLLTIPTPCTPAESLVLGPQFRVQAVLGPCSSNALSPIWATLAYNRTWVTPTYVAAYEISNWPNRAVPGDEYAQFLPDTLKKFVQWIFPMPDSIPPGADRVGKIMFDKRVALAGEMRRAGVHLLAGTDAPLRNSPPGFGLAEELATFARGGVSLYDILRIATWEPASYFAATDSIGTVKVGQVADLVLLRENPLRDVKAYRSVEAVIAGGRLIDKKGRESILEKLRRGSQ